MIISCDIDGVLNNLTECVLQLYNQESGDNLTENDITEYSIERFVKPEYRNKISQYFLDKRIWGMLKWDVGWIAKILDNNMYDLYFTTASSLKTINSKAISLAWAVYDYSSMSAINIYNYIANHTIVTQNKQLILADVVIDDCIDNLQLWNNRVHNILFVKPWNQRLAHLYNQKYDNKILLCNNGNEAMVYLQRIKQSNTN